MSDRNRSELFDPLLVSGSACPSTAAIDSTACYFHIINVGITKAITPGLMTEAEQGVKHDARRRRVVIDGATSHMMGSSLPDRGCHYSLPLKFQICNLPGRKTAPPTRSTLPCFKLYCQLKKCIL